ncbi:MAG: hypothetical protein AB7S78_14270 [Candidatus Omnitrophota bacterium]
MKREEIMKGLKAAPKEFFKFYLDRPLSRFFTFSGAVKSCDFETPEEIYVDVNENYFSRFGTWVVILGWAFLIGLFMWGVSTVFKEWKGNGSHLKMFLFTGIALYFLLGMVRSFFGSRLGFKLYKDRVHVFGWLGFKKYAAPGGFQFVTGKAGTGLNPKNIFLLLPEKKILVARLFSEKAAENLLEELHNAQKKWEELFHEVPDPSARN